MSRYITMTVPIDDERSMTIECRSGHLVLETKVVSIDPFELLRALRLESTDLRLSGDAVGMFGLIPDQARPAPGKSGS